MGDVQFSSSSGVEPGSLALEQMILTPQLALVLEFRGYCLPILMADYGPGQRVQISTPFVLSSLEASSLSRRIRADSFRERGGCPLV